MEPRAFTFKGDKIFPWLITSCGVCPAFDPDYSEGIHPSFLQFNGLWDTGASASVITERVARLLGIYPIRQVRTKDARGETDTNLYYVNILLPNRMEVKNVAVSEGVLDGFDLLIGMDIINLGDFALTHKNKGTVFSFQIPSTHEYDFVKQLQYGVGTKKR
ncbi:MAG: retroviral-like aspartic protease family protein [Bacteroidales bacterium]|nr:retroviral-like aspartic protease family protein [Bacteroidales bacterium]